MCGNSSAASASDATLSPTSAAVQKRVRVQANTGLRHMQTALEASVIVFTELANHVPMFGAVCTAMGA